jgi:hypothetical protein
MSSIDVSVEAAGSVFRIGVYSAGKLFYPEDRGSKSL